MIVDFRIFTYHDKSEILSRKMVEIYIYFECFCSFDCLSAKKPLRHGFIR